MKHNWSLLKRVKTWHTIFVLYAKNKISQWESGLYLQYWAGCFMGSIIKYQLTVIPRRKFTVNHEKRPSSDPSIMDTEFSFVRNGDVLNNFLTWNNNNNIQDQTQISQWICKVIQIMFQYIVHVWKIQCVAIYNSCANTGYNSSPGYYFKLHKTQSFLRSSHSAIKKFYIFYETKRFITKS